MDAAALARQQEEEAFKEILTERLGLTEAAVEAIRVEGITATTKLLRQGKKDIDDIFEKVRDRNIEVSVFAQRQLWVMSYWVQRQELLHLPFNAAAFSPEMQQLCNARIELESEKGPHASESYATSIRELIGREEKLVDMRISWLNCIQGFLYVALSVLWIEKSRVQGTNTININVEGVSNKMRMITFEDNRVAKIETINGLIYILGAIGILLSLSTLISTYLAQVSINKLVCYWKEYIDTYGKGSVSSYYMQRVSGLWPGTDSFKPESWNNPDDNRCCFVWCDTWVSDKNCFDKWLSCGILMPHSLIPILFVLSWVAIIFVTAFVGT